MSEKLENPSLKECRASCEFEVNQVINLVEILAVFLLFYYYAPMFGTRHGPTKPSQIHSNRTFSIEFASVICSFGDLVLLNGFYWRYYLHNDFIDLFRAHHNTIHTISGYTIRLIECRLNGMLSDFWRKLFYLPHSFTHLWCRQSCNSNKKLNLINGSKSHKHWSRN